MPRTIFRVFLSSTFGDFQAEREKLRAEVWPRLEALCAAHGASFHIVDLRWGISPSVATTHDTIKICLDEVIRCQQLSPRPKPNFLMLIGDRYGWRPPAVQIPDDDFRLIQKNVSDENFTFLKEWYQRDDNAVPPVWCLKPRTGKYASYDDWGPVETSLTAILHDVAERLALSTSLRASLAPEQYLYSATHMEIVSGLLHLEGLQDHIFSFNREISGLPDPAPKGIARRFTDHLGDGSRDPVARQLLQVLKSQITEVLPESQIKTFQADWIGDETSPITLHHLDDYCAAIEQALRDIITAEIKEISQTTDLQEEREIQQIFLEETGKLLIGRDKELKRIQAYLNRKKTPLPLIITAKGGAGKSALMAKAILQIPPGPPLQSGEQANPSQPPFAKGGALKSPFRKGDLGGFAVDSKDAPILIYRFIGAAPRSWQPLTFLQDLIQQIAEAYGQESPSLPEEGGIKKIAELFHQQLELATTEQPLTIFIDAIDQFSNTTPVQYSDLFPKRLPDNVKMVISVLEGKDADQLNKMYPKAPRIQLKQLSSTACGKILDALLPGRKLTKEQRKAILDKGKKSGLPLWLTLVAPIARKLNSWDAPPDLPDDIKKLARFVIERIADKHGFAITTASLRYLKLSRFGLSETELQELLWADPEVHAEFDKTKNPDQPAVTALPPVFWSRLYAELDPYINEYWMDGQLLHRYFHRVFGEVADEMDEETRKTLHGRLADYFDQQPLYNEQQPNGRKLMEQAWHLTLANRNEEARATITDFDFAMAKCRLNRSDDWADDFRRAVQGEKIRDYKIWESFVKTNANILRRGNFEWPAHKILLQLAIEHADDSPATIAAEKFLAEGKCDWAWIRRELRVKHAGIDPCLAVFEGHDQLVIDALEITEGNILSWSVDNTLRIWDKESGLCLSILEGHEGEINGAFLLPDKRILSWSDDSTLRIWDKESGLCQRILKGHEGGVNGAFLLPDKRILSWSDDSTLRIWDLESGICLKILEGHFDSVNDVKLLSDGNLLSCSLDNTIQMWDSLNGQNLSKIQVDDLSDLTPLPGGYTFCSDNNTLQLGHIDNNFDHLREKLQDLETILCLPEGRILSWGGDNTPRILDRNNGECIAKLEGHQFEVDGVLLLADWRILSWAFWDPLRIWDSRTGECLSILRGHSDRIEGVKILSDDLIISCSDDKTFRLWDCRTIENLEFLDGHINKVFNLIFNPIFEDRLLSKGELDKAARVWNTNTGKCLATFSGEVSFLSDGRILSCSDEGAIHILSDSGEPLSMLNGHTESVNGALLLPDGRILSWSDDHTLRIWSNGGRPLAVLDGHTNSVSDVLLLPSGRILSWSDDKTLRLWSNAGGPMAVLEGHTDGVKGALLMPDSRILSWAGGYKSKDCTLRLWSDTGEPMAVLEGHTDGVKGALLMPDSRILSWAGGYKSKDCTLRLWSDTGEQIAVLEGHTDLVYVPLLLPNGRILSRSYDNTLRLWSEHGEAIAVYNNNNLFDLEPMVWQSCFPKSQQASGARLIDRANAASIVGQVDQLVWQGQSICHAYYLIADGRAIITQENGQVCFLQTYVGNARVTIEELGL